MHVMVSYVKLVRVRFELGRGGETRLVVGIVPLSRSPSPSLERCADVTHTLLNSSNLVQTTRRDCSDLSSITKTSEESALIVLCL
jgi:hypothetical protein